MINNILYLNIPKVCPICGGPTKIVESDSGVLNLICENPQCGGKLINRLDFFAGKKGLDIRGLSKATLEKLIDWGWVSNIKDIFSLYNHRVEWIRKTGFGPKSVDNILAAIEKAKECELSAFITALGIPLIGSTYAKEIAKKEFDWHNFREDVEGKFDFTRWDGFGAEMCLALRKFNYSEADELVNILNIKNSLWINPEEKSKEIKSLDGMKIVITGSLKEFKNRAAAQADIEKLGGKVIGSVSKNTDILINNDSESNSSKNVSAKKLGIPIMTEKEFIEKYF